MAAEDLTPVCLPLTNAFPTPLPPDIILSQYWLYQLLFKIYNLLTTEKLFRAETFFFLSKF